MGLFDKIKDNFTKGEFELERKMKVNDVCKNFKEAFGLSLRIYKGAAIADGRMTIDTLDQRIKKEITADAGKLKIKANEKVGEVEKKFSDHFGLKVQIASSENTFLVDNNLTLGEANRQKK